MTILDDDRTIDVCRRGQGELTCRYLVLGGGGFRCAKRSYLAPVLDERVSRGEIGARGDNCEGV
jgi:hypothetical protein